MTVLEKFANLATTTVPGGGTDAPSSGTSENWTVSSSAPFPSITSGTSQFHVADPAANSEIIAVTSISGTTWTVTRGAESTTPVSHSAGFTIYQVTTAGFLGAVPQSVAAGDSSISVSGTQAVSVETGTLDAIANSHPPAANWSNNSYKITSLADGSASSDAAAYGQTPAGGNTATVAQGGTGVASLSAYAILAGGTASTADIQQVSGLGSAGQVLTSSGAGALPTWQTGGGGGGGVTSVTAGDTSIVIGGTDTEVTVETATLDVIAADHPPAASWSNNSQKITSLENGSASSDAAAYGQTPAGGNTVTIAQGGTGTGTTSQNYIFAGPSSGGSGAPLFRAMATADVPTLNQSTTGNAGTATNLAGGATLPDYLAPAVVSLTDAATVSVNASSGNDFRLVTTSGIGTARTMGTPSSAVDGQRITFQVEQASSGGPYTITWSSVWDFGAAGSPTLSTAASTWDVIGFIYNATKSKWFCAGSALGF